MEWITWVRQSHRRGGGEEKVTREATRGRPVTYTSSRPATGAEIAEELHRRAEREQHAQRERDFRSRPDFIAADAIRGEIEHMTPEDNPLDRLTVIEWQQLAERITGQRGQS